MTKKSKTDTPDVAPARYVMVEYRGVAAAQPGQKERKHKRSPLLAFWPEPGTPRIAWQPGLNVKVLASTWATYAGIGEDNPGHPQIKEMHAAGEVRMLRHLPTDAGELRELIERTIDLDALAHIREQLGSGAMEQDGPLFSGARGAARRESLMTDLAEQITKANPVLLKLPAWQARPETSTLHAMG